MATVTKRGETYKITVSCGYDCNGKQIRRSITWKPASGMTKKQIEKELERQKVLFEEQIASGELLQSSSMKLGEFCGQYLDILRSSDSVSPTTIAMHERAINHYILPALGHIKMKDIKPIHVQKFVQELSRELPNTSTRNQGQPTMKLKPATVKRYYVVLQSILSRACKLGAIASNPATSSKIDLPQQGQQETEIFTKEEAGKMLACLNNEPVIYQALIHLAIVTGARKGELLALTWDHVDLNAGTVCIKQSMYKLKGEAQETKSTKSGRSRTVSIPAYCVSLLQDYRVHQNRERAKAGDQWQNGNWVFTQWNGKPMHINTPSHWFSKFLAKYNLPHRKFHALRHTSATLLLANGTNIKTVASRLGHAQLSTTNLYLHSIEEADRVASQSFETILQIPSQKREKQA